MRNKISLCSLIAFATAMVPGLSAAQSAPGSRSLGPFICPSFCALNTLTPESPTTVPQTALRDLLVDHRQTDHMVPGDKITFCNVFNCAAYKLTDSDIFQRIGIEARMSTPPNGDPQPHDPPSSGAGKNIPLVYWPSSSSGPCVKATITYGASTTVEVYCG